MKMNKGLFLVVLVLAASCGGKNGSPEVGGSHSDAATICDVKFNKEDSAREIAIKSNRARVKCGLSETEVLQLIQ